MDPWSFNCGPQRSCIKTLGLGPTNLCFNKSLVILRLVEVGVLG